MAEFIRVSRASLDVIPAEHRFSLHEMYEDSDLDGASQAEGIYDFIDSEAPGAFVAVLANDSVTPPCCNAEMHYPCDYYDPYWYTVLIAQPVWEHYEKAVMAKDQAWKAAHGCKLSLDAYNEQVLDTAYGPKETR